MEQFLWLIAVLLTVEVIFLARYHRRITELGTGTVIVWIGVGIVALAGLTVLVYGYGQGRPYEVAHSIPVYALLTVGLGNVAWPFIYAMFGIVTDPALQSED